MEVIVVELRTNAQSRRVQPRRALFLPSGLALNQRPVAYVQSTLTQCPNGLSDRVRVKNGGNTREARFFGDFCGSYVETPQWKLGRFHQSSGSETTQSLFGPSISIGADVTPMEVVATSKKCSHKFHGVNMHSAHRHRKYFMFAASDKRVFATLH